MSHRSSCNRSIRRAGRFFARRGTAALLALVCVTGCSHARLPSVTQKGEVQPQPELQKPGPSSPWVNSLGMKFVSVPGTHVRFAVWETRVCDFDAFVRATGYDAGRAMFVAESNRWELHQGFNWHNPGFPQSPTDPVVGVNWHDAKAFCRWLTEKEHAEGLLTAAQRYRLPTDLEWSRAVGLTNEPGRTSQERFVQVKDVYPWGTNSPPPINSGNFAPSFGVDSFPRTSPVGSFPANRYGLHDLAGNVIEWCEDWWNQQERFRVLRGSGWHTDCLSCLLSSYRYPNLPDLRIDYYGFRVVLEGAVVTPRR